VLVVVRMETVFHPHRIGRQEQLSNAALVAGKPWAVSAGGWPGR
jgi:hypothetical protein